jgi:hypothetical protein
MESKSSKSRVFHKPRRKSMSKTVVKFITRYCAEETENTVLSAFNFACHIYTKSCTIPRYQDAFRVLAPSFTSLSMKDNPNHNRCSTPCQVVQVPHTSDTEIVQLTHCMQPIFSSSYTTAHLGNKSCFYGNQRFIIGSMKTTLSLLSPDDAPIH